MDDDGISVAYCSGRVEHVLRRVVREVERCGLEVSALIDHSGDAHEADLELPETKLLLFGAPAVGTPLIRAHPLIALDLPLRLLLVAVDDDRVLLAYNAQDHFCLRYGLTPAEAAPFEGVESIVRAVAGT